MLSQSQRTTTRRTALQTALSGLLTEARHCEVRGYSIEP
jgi:hypothetical protein